MPSTWEAEMAALSPNSHCLGTDIIQLTWIWRIHKKHHSKADSSHSQPQISPGLSVWVMGYQHLGQNSRASLLQQAVLPWPWFWGCWGSQNGRDASPRENTGLQAPLDICFTMGNSAQCPYVCFLSAIHRKPLVLGCMEKCHVTAGTGENEERLLATTAGQGLRVAVPHSRGQPEHRQHLPDQSGPNWWLENGENKAAINSLFV